MTSAPPLLLGVDGRSGAGKSTFAAALAARLEPHARVAVLAIESMYPGWDGLAAALAPEGPYPTVLRELRERGEATWRTWDWEAGAPGPAARIGPADLVVCEGVGALCAAARPMLTLGVWLEVEDGTRRRRALARDGEAYAPHWDRWAAQERRYLADEDPRAAADLILPRA